MKRVTIIALLIILSLPAFAAWEPLGPYGGSLTSVAVAPSNDNLIYIAPSASPCAIHKSTDAGASWTRQGTIASNVYSMAVDPANQNVAYAGGNSAIYKTTDGGLTWNGYSPSGLYFYSLAVHPTSTNTVFAAGYARWGTKYVMGFFKTTDGGANWTSTPLDTFSGIAYSVAVDPTNPNTVYVGGYNYTTVSNPKVYKSTNGGSTFADVSAGIPQPNYYIFSLAVHPTNSSIVYAGSFNATFRSTNGGTGWTQTSPYSYIYSIATTRAAVDIVYGGGDSCVYKSTNAGASWFVSGSGIGGSGKGSRTIAASQTSASAVCVTDMKGFFKSTNGGTNWFVSNHGINIAVTNCIGLAPSAPSTIYTEAYGVGVFRSTNNGTSWSALAAPLECGNICAFAVHNTNPNSVMGLEGSG